MHPSILAAGGGSSLKFDLESIQKAAAEAGITTENLDKITSNLQGTLEGSGSVTLLVIFFCLAIGVSFFCSVWEAVLLSITRPYVESLKATEGKEKVGALIEDLKTRIDRPLTSILTLNTISHTMGTVGVTAQIVKLTGGGMWETIGGVVMTLAVLIGSEIIPKNLGARHWKSWAPWVAVCLKWLCKLMYIPIKIIGLFSKGGHLPEGFSRDELTVMADMGEKEGELHEDESRILKNLLQLREMTVDVAKTPRIVVFALPKDTTAGEYVQEHADSPFSRIPIYAENRDDIDGFVIKDDILLAAALGETEKTLEEMSREITMLSELIPLHDAFLTLNENRHHIAIVHDEFGGMSGLVTMEDIVETLLGLEIVDEVDTKDDTQVFARNLWERRADKMGLDLTIPSAVEEAVSEIRKEVTEHADAMAKAKKKEAAAKAEES